jgi:UDP-glucose:glycoprotein glucosyltransferase
MSSKAAYLVANSSDPLVMLRQMSQNFPKYASAVARRVPEPPQEFLEETASARMQLPPGFSGFWINGLMINEGDVNPLRYALVHSRSLH